MTRHTAYARIPDTIDPDDAVVVSKKLIKDEVLDQPAWAGILRAKDTTITTSRKQLAAKDAASLKDAEHIERMAEAITKLTDDVEAKDARIAELEAQARERDDPPDCA